MANGEASEAQKLAVQPHEVEELIEAAAQPHAHANANQPAIQQAFANYQDPPPEKFWFKPEDWPRWIQHLERFRKATGVNQKDGENQVNTLIYSMGEEANDIVVSFGLTATETQQYKVLLGSRDGAVVRALASHQCGPGSTPGPGVVRGSSLLLVLVLAPRGFSPGFLEALGTTAIGFPVNIGEGSHQGPSV